MIKKEDAWITFSTAKNGKINGLTVRSRKAHIESRSNWIPECDIGCVRSDWNEWSLEDVLLKLFYQYGFDGKKTETRALNHLCEIEEFSEKIKKWMKD